MVIGVFGGDDVDELVGVGVQEGLHLLVVGLLVVLEAVGDVVADPASCRFVLRVVASLWRAWG